LHLVGILFPHINYTTFTLLFSVALSKYVKSTYSGLINIKYFNTLDYSKKPKYHPAQTIPQFFVALSDDTKKTKTYFETLQLNMLF